MDGDGLTFQLRRNRKERPQERDWLDKGRRALRKERERKQWKNVQSSGE
jgi:tRNA pseudouridine-54 N-methylase